MFLPVSQWNPVLRDWEKILLNTDHVLYFTSEGDDTSSAIAHIPITNADSDVETMKLKETLLDIRSMVGK